MAVKSTPLTQNLAFNTHVEQVAKEFAFLVSEFGYELSKNEFKGREFWIVYSKEAIDIEILFELGGLPFVTLRNNKLPYDEANYIDNGDSVEEFNPKAQQIKNNRYERREKPNADLSDDYNLYGRAEHIASLKEAASTVRENIELRRGNLGMRE
ncbi:hypothetical protein [Algoriphagus chordae]|uniref:Uncharacterized protein n=1 Tax=Algoriphagus chordae TaxID=237019 RepID=A0A2W7R2G2_9BACT|nr:hypothetical protein [Algoriphagus chordae]PZX54973.1 hypothetical protein LV85_01314 [Algoriphagus chordae]